MITYLPVFTWITRCILNFMKYHAQYPTIFSRVFSNFSVKFSLRTLKCSAGCRYFAHWNRTDLHQWFSDESILLLPTLPTSLRSPMTEESALSLPYIFNMLGSPSVDLSRASWIMPNLGRWNYFRNINDVHAPVFSVRARLPPAIKN